MNTHWLPAGTVTGTLLNFRQEVELWRERANQPPYGAPPVAPVLYIKTANTFTPSGSAIALPGGLDVEVAASLGLVMGEGGAVSHAVLVNDVSVAHDSYHRPAVKQRCRDGFLGLGQDAVALDAIGGLDALAALSIELRIHGVHRQTTHLADLVRDAPTLLRDVQAFMTLGPGDVLLLGSDCLPDGTRLRVVAGDVVEITAPGFKPALHRFAEVAP